MKNTSEHPEETRIYEVIEEMRASMGDNAYSMESVSVVNEVFEYICTKKEQATIQMLMRTSRLPLKHAKTFENFDFSVLKGKDIERLKSLPSLAPIYAHRNLAFIGPAGTG